MNVSSVNLEDLFLRLTEEAALRHAEGADDADAKTPAGGADNDVTPEDGEYKPVFSEEGGDEE